jgi:DNA-binding transcriptional ArsR family regulator
MVWRIHFTADDLERIQVRPTLGPLAETVKAMGLLRCPQQPRATYRQWRGQVKDRLTPQMAAFTAMIPPGSKGVDLSMVTGPAATLEEGVKALLTVPREHLLVEMDFADQECKLPASVWAAAETGQARLQLAAAAVAAHQVLVEPYWTRIHACLHAEHVAGLRALAAGGPDRLLASLQSQWVRWRPPVLEVLRTLADGCSTTELADRVGISLAAASQHASVLRDAGLITTHRQGSAVLHVLTPLGVELLRAG